MALGTEDWNAKPKGSGQEAEVNCRWGGKSEKEWESEEFWTESLNFNKMMKRDLDRKKKGSWTILLGYTIE